MEGVRLGGKWRERSRGKKIRGRWRAMRVCCEWFACCHSLFICT